MKFLLFLSIEFDQKISYQTEDILFKLASKIFSKNLIITTKKGGEKISKHIYVVKSSVDTLPFFFERGRHLIRVYSRAEPRFVQLTAKKVLLSTIVCNIQLNYRTTSVSAHAYY